MPSAGKPHAAGPPRADPRPQVTELHGDTRVDEYAWLRQRDDPEAIAYLEAENAWADAALQPTKPLQERLYQEILGRIKETDLSVPYREGEHVYYSRTEEGKQYAIHCRKRGDLEAAEEILLDLNVEAEGHEFIGLGAWAVSDDGNLLAYSLDPTGFRVYRLQVKDLRTGELLADSAEDVGSVVWAADNRTLFYTTKDQAKRPYRLWRHTLGGTKDNLVHEEKDELFRMWAGRTRSRSYLLLYCASFTTSEVRWLPADRPEEAFRLVLQRLQDREYDVDHHGDRFYLRINDAGRNFRLVSAAAGEVDPETWEEVLPHRDEVMLEGVDFFAEHWVAWEREGGLPQVRVTDLRGGVSHRIDFPAAAYSTSPSANRLWDTRLLRFRYESLVTPASVYDYHIDSRGRELLKQDEVVGGHDPDAYRTERLHATAPDGARIPISLVRRADVPQDGRAPLYLIGYGSYGMPYPVSFSSSRLSMLDRGVVLAIAHIRGGGEMGKKWHDQGRMMQKLNTFTDFIAVAEHLTAEKHGSPERLVVEGGSAGGLLMGAIANLRPDLFRAVVSHVPFVDVLNTMLDSSLPLTVGEYEEWGNPNEREAYRYIRRYCPYSNLEAKDYPAMLVKTSLQDSQVMYWEPAKYVARLRTLKTDDNPLLLVTNMGGGHGGSSGRYDKMRETALSYAFILTQVGIEE